MSAALADGLLVLGLLQVVPGITVDWKGEVGVYVISDAASEHAGMACVYWREDGRHHETIHSRLGDAVDFFMQRLRDRQP